MEKHKNKKLEKELEEIRQEFQELKGKEEDFFNHKKIIEDEIIASNKIEGIDLEDPKEKKELTKEQVIKWLQKNGLTDANLEWEKSEKKIQESINEMNVIAEMMRENQLTKDEEEKEFRNNKRGVCFRGTNFRFSIFNDAKLRNVLFSHALIEKGHFWRTNFKNSNFLEANLTNVKFKDCFIVEDNKIIEVDVIVKEKK